MFNTPRPQPRCALQRWTLACALLILGCGPSAAPTPKPVAVVPAPAPAPPVASPPPEPVVPPEELEPVRAPDPAAPPLDPERAGERVLFYTTRGPLLVQLLMTIDGEPFRAAREELLDALMAASDADGDGQLTWDEALRDPRFAIGQAANFAAMNQQQQREQIKQWDLNQNGIVERNEADIFVAQADNSGGAFDFDVNSFITYDEGSRLWRMLDENRDLALDAEEVARLAPLLQGLDADDDELVRFAEVQNPRDEGSMRRGGYTRVPAVHLREGAAWNAILYDLEQQYDLFEGLLAAASFPIDPELVPRLDSNGNGYLDRDEVQNLLTVEPHLVIELHLGNTYEYQHGMHLRYVAAALGTVDDVIQVLPDGLALKLTGGQARFSWRDASAPNFDAQARARLEQLDEDKNGYLDEDEVSEEDLADQFATLDRDGDGKLFPDEILDLFRWRQAPAASRIRGTADGQQLALFAVVDENSDRILNPREIKAAVERILALDRDGDGRVSQYEVPSRASLALVRGAGDAAMGMAAGGPAAGGAPGWFNSMDGNGDGDVSQREFLGSPEQFSQLDRNGDGLLEASEVPPEPASSSEDEQAVPAPTPEGA